MTRRNRARLGMASLVCAIVAQAADAPITMIAFLTLAAGLALNVTYGER